MTFLGLEKPVEYGRELVFDPTTAQMVLNANRDYINAVYNDYRLALADMKEFNKEYGDFLSPIQADMDWYELNVTGRLKSFIDDLYSKGIDPLRSVEGRSAVTRELAKIPTPQIALKRLAAESAKEYIKNRDAIKKAGMWNEDYERAMLGGLLLEEWDNSLGSWKATSVSPYMDYELKYGHLFDKMGLEYDPEESKKFPGMYVMTKNKSRMHDILSASRPDLINDPQYKYDLGRIKAENPGISDDEAAKFIENEIVERNYKGGMEIKENPYTMLAAKSKMDRDNILLLDRLARDRDALKFQYQAALKGMAGTRGADGGSKYGSLTGAPYNLPEEVHHDALFTAITNQGIPVYKLTNDGKGNIVPVKVKGLMVLINPDDATWEELEYAANNKSALITKQESFAKKQAGNRPYSFIFDQKVQDNYLNTFGYHINSLEVGSLFPTKTINKDGSMILSTTDIRNLKKMLGIIANSMGSRAKYSKEKNLADVLPKDQEGWISNSNYVKSQLDSGGRVQASFVFDDSSEKNIIQLVGDDGESQIWVKGNVTYITGASAGKQTPMSTVEDVWLPTNIKSNKAIYQKFSTSTPWKSNFGLNSKFRSAYDAMAAHYAKVTGSQKNTNVALEGTSFDDLDESQWPLFFNNY